MYEIKYAYPSSTMARQLNKYATGCYYVELDGNDTGEPFQSLDEAREFAESTGHSKSSYSM